MFAPGFTTQLQAVIFPAPPPDETKSPAKIIFWSAVGVQLDHEVVYVFVTILGTGTFAETTDVHVALLAVKV